MRYKINEHTQIGTLIKDIKPTETSHTFHIRDDLKIVVNCLRLCEICKKWFRNGDMSKLDDINCCWACEENARKME